MKESEARIGFLSGVVMKIETASVTTSVVAEIAPDLAAACAAEGCDLPSHLKEFDHVVAQARGLRQMADAVKSVYCMTVTSPDAPVSQLADLHSVLDGWMQREVLAPIITDQLKQEVVKFQSAYSLKAKAVPMFDEGMHDLKATKPSR